MDREVTERDFRMPEFYSADPKDYERREDGKIVRKDRWEDGVRRCAFIVGLGNKRGGWEINEVVDAVRALGLREEVFVRMRDALRALLEAEHTTYPDTAAVEVAREALVEAYALSEASEEAGGQAHG